MPKSISGSVCDGQGNGINKFYLGPPIAWSPNTFNSSVYNAILSGSVSSIGFTDGASGTATLGVIVQLDSPLPDGNTQFDVVLHPLVNGQPVVRTKAQAQSEYDQAVTRVGGPGGRSGGGGGFGENPGGGNDRTQPPAAKMKPLVIVAIVVAGLVGIVLIFGKSITKLFKKS